MASRTRTRFARRGAPITMTCILLVAVVFWAVGFQAHRAQSLLETVRSGDRDARLEALDQLESSRTIRLVAPPVLIRQALERAIEDGGPEVEARARALRESLRRERAARLGGERRPGPGPRGV